MNTRNVLTCLLLTIAGHLQAQVSVSDYSATYTQNFDTLISAGTSGVLSNGWFSSETGALANTLVAADYGNLAVGDTYSYGATGSTERALGTLASLDLKSTIGAAFQNDGNENLIALTISYRGEAWRVKTVNRPDRLDFEYSVDATSLTTGTWTAVDALDFVTPSTSPKGTVDGNSAASSTFFAPTTISGLSIAPGSTVWIRWMDFDPTGAEDGLAVDDFTAQFQSAAVVPEPSAALVLLAGTVALAARRRRAA